MFLFSSNTGYFLGSKPLIDCGVLLHFCIPESMTCNKPSMIVNSHVYLTVPLIFKKVTAESHTGRPHLHARHTYPSSQKKKKKMIHTQTYIHQFFSRIFIAIKSPEGSEMYRRIWTNLHRKTWSNFNLTVCESLFYLTKHLVVLNILDFVGADLPLQCVLVELAAYIDQ